jgi:CRP-like cAMP-binding protein
MLSQDDRQLIEPSFEAVELDLRMMIEQPNKPIEHIYFPESGVISIVARSSDRREIEAGVIGREGMSGIPVVMGDHRSPHDAYVQIAGAGFRIGADTLRSAIAASASLHAALLRFAQAFAVQVAQTALANGRAKVDERLARWLLMAHDRLDSERLPLTHDFIALMLGVRRPGVTDALHELEGNGLIQSSRGAVEILDRVALEGIAGGAYGVPEAEYQRLTGARLSKTRHN